jgi:hypothetical protein
MTRMEDGGEAGKNQPGSPSVAAIEAQRRGGVELRLSNNADEVSRLAELLVLDDTVNLCKERIITADTDVHAGTEPGSPLTHEDASGCHALAPVPLDAEVLRVAIATVARTSNAFLVCHTIPLLLDDLRYLYPGLPLAMAAPDAIAFAPFLFEDNDRIALMVIQDGPLYPRAGEVGGSDTHRCAVSHKEHMIEADAGPGLFMQAGDNDRVVGVDRVLTACDLDHGKHGYSPQEKGTSKGSK